jgi:hypothetical protein
VATPVTPQAQIGQRRLQVELRAVRERLATPPAAEAPATSRK